MSLAARIPVHTAAGVRELDRHAIEQAGIKGLTLMGRAGEACVDALLRTWPGARRVLVCCGAGNNAGDGYIIAGRLAEKGLDVSVCAIGAVEKLGPDASEAHRYCRSTAASFVSFDPGLLEGADVVVDALLGTGLSGDVRENYLAVIEAVNAADVPVLAVDIPSGLSADTGARLGAAIAANVTVTFIGRKQGLYTLDGADCAGEVVFDDLGVPASTLESVPPAAGILQLVALQGLLPPRPNNAHKNTFGHVVVIGGDEGMGGAVAMCAETALRSGAGMVSVATHPLHVTSILARRPELMVRGVDHPDDLAPLLGRATVVALGPGLGRSAWSTRIFKRAMEVTRSESLPVVLDADGLNLLALHPESRDNWVLTPHPGEAGNLMQDNRIQADRFGSVKKLKQKFGGVALLKGAGTLIAADDDIDICVQGNPGMSTAGMGDVLGGLIAALIAQGLAPVEAARLGAVVHATAGDVLAGRWGVRGMVATDLLPEIRKLLNPEVSE